MIKAMEVMNKLLKSVITILVGMICLIVIWQVFTRFVLRNPSPWSEEISRYFLIWITFLGGAMGLGEGAHITLEVVTERITSSRARTVLHIFSFFVCAYLGYVFIRYGCVYMMSGMKRTMMCCKIPMGYVYAVMPVSGVVILIKSFQIIYYDIRNLKNGIPPGNSKGE